MMSDDEITIQPIEFHVPTKGDWDKASSDLEKFGSVLWPVQIMTKAEFIKMYPPPKA
jgi:hypothetical protein